MINSCNNRGIVRRKLGLQTVIHVVLLLGIGLSLQGCYGYWGSETTEAEQQENSGPTEQVSPGDQQTAPGDQEMARGESAVEEKHDENLRPRKDVAEKFNKRLDKENTHMMANVDPKAKAIRAHHVASFGESLLRRDHQEQPQQQLPDYIDQQKLQSNRELLKQVKTFVEKERSIAADQISTQANEHSIQTLAERQDHVDVEMKHMLEQLAGILEPPTYVDPTEAPERIGQVDRTPTPAPTPHTAEQESEDPKMLQSGWGADQKKEMLKNLKKRIAALEASRLPFSVNRPRHEVELQNFNLKVSSLAHEHGTGNLIIGDENDVKGAADSIVQGFHNTAVGESVAVIGGNDNVGQGDFTTVTGGRQNLATGLASSISGGIENQASAIGASVVGGIDNVADGRGSVAAGGEQNDATGVASVAMGGGLNLATNKLSGTFAGYMNKAVGPNSGTFIGYANTANGYGVGIIGGENVHETERNKILVGRVGPPAQERNYDCDKCAEDFKAKGGCKALKDGNTAELLRLRPTDDIECAPCANDVENSCPERVLPFIDLTSNTDHCEPCLSYFVDKGGCEGWASGNWSHVAYVVQLMDRRFPGGSQNCSRCEQYAEDRCGALGHVIGTGPDLMAGQGPPLVENEMSLCPKCTKDFVGAGGCDAWRAEEWEQFHQKVSDLGSACFQCETHIADHCEIPLNLRDDEKVVGITKNQAECQTCVWDFHSNGGCQAWAARDWVSLDVIAPKYSDECFGCEKWAAEDCGIAMELRGTASTEREREQHQGILGITPQTPGKFTTGTACYTCMAKFEKQGGCTYWSKGDWAQVEQLEKTGLGAECKGCIADAERLCSTSASAKTVPQKRAGSMIKNEVKPTVTKQRENIFNEGVFTLKHPGHHPDSNIAESLPAEEIHFTKQKKRRHEDTSKEPASLNEAASSSYPPRSYRWGPRLWGRH